MNWSVPALSEGVPIIRKEMGFIKLCWRQNRETKWGQPLASHTSYIEYGRPDLSSND